jgi:hypothetical protein
VIIDAKGKAREIVVRKSLDSFIENEIIELIKKTEWYPAEINGTPVMCKIILPVYL